MGDGKLQVHAPNTYFKAKYFGESVEVGPQKRDQRRGSKITQLAVVQVKVYKGPGCWRDGRERRHCRDSSSMILHVRNEVGGMLKMTLATPDAVTQWGPVGMGWRKNFKQETLVLTRRRYHHPPKAFEQELKVPGVNSTFSWSPPPPRNLSYHF